MNVVVVLPNWIGDVVMATPALRAIRSHYGPDAKITGVMKPYVSEVLAGTTWLDRTILFNRKSKVPQQQFRAVVAQLRQIQPDAVILFPNSLTSGLLAWLSGARRRVGYVRNGRGLLLTDRLFHPRERGRFVLGKKKWAPVSAVDTFLELAYQVGCPPQDSPQDPRRLELATLPEDERIVERIWEKFRFHESRSVIAINTGGAYGAAKDWPTEYFAELARRVVETNDASVLVLCGPNERETAALIERLADNPRVRCMADEDLSLGVSKACIRRSQLMVSTDSGPRQFAAAFNVPIVALFGPIDPRWSANYHPGESQLQNPVPCGPCGKRVCPLGHHRCMRDLSVERVFQEVARKLSLGDSWAA